jgi:hypothetical protein
MGRGPGKDKGSRPATEDDILDVARKVTLLKTILRGRLNRAQREHVFFQLLESWWPRAMKKHRKREACQAKAIEIEALINRTSIEQRIPKYEARLQVTGKTSDTYRQWMRRNKPRRDTKKAK